MTNSKVASRRWHQFTIGQFFAFVAVVGAVLAYRQLDSRAVVPYRTGRSLDLAILGRGYFQVRDPATGRSKYTRNGHFIIGPQGDLMIGRPVDERLLQPQISIPADWTELTISRNGIVAVQQEDNASLTQVAQLQLACFMNDEALREEEPGLFGETEFSAPAMVATPGSNGAGTLLQGWLNEPSGVAALVTREGIQTALFGGIALVLACLVLQVRNQRRMLSAILVRLGDSTNRAD